MLQRRECTHEDVARVNGVAIWKYTAASDRTHLFHLIEDVGQVAATAVLAVVHGSHEDTGTALQDH